MFYFDIASMVSNILPWVFIIGTVVGLGMYVSGRMHIDGNDGNNGGNGQNPPRAGGQQQAQPRPQQPPQQPPQQQAQQPPRNGGI